MRAHAVIRLLLACEGLITAAAVTFTDIQTRALALLRAPSVAVVLSLKGQRFVGSASKQHNKPRYCLNM